MQNGVHRHAEVGSDVALAGSSDVIGAIVAVEAMQVGVLDAGALAADAAASVVARNAFGDPVAVERDGGDTAARVTRAKERVHRGERVALLASTSELLGVRGLLVAMAEERLAAVFHAIEPAGPSDAYALSEIGWGVLFASSVQESVDLTLAARRAAEDSGTPFLVVHELAPSHGAPPPVLPAASLVAAFVGPASSHLRAAADPGHPAHAQVGARAFAERVPFALGSAMRELDSLTGRKQDVATRSPAGQGGEAPCVLVGVGALGDVLLAEVPRLRAEGHDVGAVKLTALRPFPGPRVVRMLARAHAITIVEHVDTPLAQSSPVAREVKSAFADALTWAPDYPGIGRIPRVHSGVHPSGCGLGATDLDALVRNMTSGEHGKRFFVLGGDREHDLEPSSRDEQAASGQR